MKKNNIRILAVLMALFVALSVVPVMAGDDSPTAKDISKANITLVKTSSTYTGSKQTPAVKITLDGVTLVQDTDYKLTTLPTTAKSFVGTYTVRAVATGIGKYRGTVGKKFTYKITKATPTITGKKVSCKKSKVKKSKVTLSAITVKGGKSATYKKTGGSKYLTVTKSGKIVVKKHTCKKSTKSYYIKVKVSVKSNTNYKAATKTLKIYVNMK